MARIAAAFLFAITTCSAQEPQPALHVQFIVLQAGSDGAPWLKIDTRTGKVWQIDIRLTGIGGGASPSRQVNSASLADGTVLGRFHGLVEKFKNTDGNFTVLLVDQIDGRCWLMTPGINGLYTFLQVPDPG